MAHKRGDARQTARGVGVARRSHVGYGIHDAAHELIAQRGEAFATLGELCRRLFERGGEAYGAGYVLGARAHAALLGAATDKGRDGEALAQIERSDAARPVKLVARERERIDAEAGNVDRDMAHRLHGVGVKGYAARMGDANASIPTTQPVLMRPMFGADGMARAASCLTFTSRAAAERGVGETLGLKRKVAPVESCRKIGKRDMRLNDATPDIDVDPETYEVRVDGEAVTCAPVDTLPLAQRYKLF